MEPSRASAALRGRGSWPAIAQAKRVCYTSRRKGGRVVEGTALEKRQALTGFVGSNPTPSARACEPGRQASVTARFAGFVFCRFVEESHRGLVGAPGKRVCESTVGSNPTSSANLSPSIARHHVRVTGSAAHFIGCAHPT
jgi:hypothetical protein